MGSTKRTVEYTSDGGDDYELVAAGQTGQVLGGAGSVHDFLSLLVITVNTAATSTVNILDGATSIPIMPATTPVGVYSIWIGARSQSGPWSVTTGAGAQVMAVGQFTQ